MKAEQVNFKPCDIISRHSTKSNIHWYTAIVTLTTEKDGSKMNDLYLVKYLPRYAIRFVNKPYTKDQYGKGAFRQPIGITETMMPEQWMDLGEKVVAKDEL